MRKIRRENLSPNPSPPLERGVKSRFSYNELGIKSRFFLVPPSPKRRWGLGGRGSSIF